MSVRVVGYLVECACGEDLGIQHEFMSVMVPGGAIVESFFGPIHRCRSVSDDARTAGVALMFWGRDWNPDRERQWQAMGQPELPPLSTDPVQLVDPPAIDD